MDFMNCMIYGGNDLSYTLIENNYKFDIETRQLNISFEKRNEPIKIIINEIIILLENFIPPETNLFSYIDIEFIRILIFNEQPIGEPTINSFRLYYDFFKEYITSDGANKIIKIPFYKIFNNYLLKKKHGLPFC